ncbi:MAG: hypothetical protein P8163_10455 [Candidatus Thiodiazotropha sp.]
MDATQGSQFGNASLTSNSQFSNDCSRTEMHCDGTSITYDNGCTTFNGTNGSDNIDVCTNWDGSTDITCNGETYHLTAEQSQNLTINGAGGDDNITSRGFQLFGDNNLTLNGGSGDDTINGGFGNETINGGSGDDTLNGGWGCDNINGGSGDDTIDGGWGRDNINGGSGDDTIDGGPCVDSIDGGSGDDTVNGHPDGGFGPVIDAGDGNPPCPSQGGDGSIIINGDVNINVDNSTNTTNNETQPSNQDSGGGLPSFLDPLGLLGGGGPNLGGGSGFPLNLIPFK